MTLEQENKELRGKLLSFQMWMERQIALGLLDIENAPLCFDRSKSHLKEIIENDKSIGTHCAYCGHKFEPGEKKITDNHVLFFHVGACKERYEQDILIELYRPEK